MPTEITPEQRDSLTPDADRILRITDAIMDHLHEGVSTAETAAAIRAELIALGWRAPGPATEAEVERAAREICMKERGRDPDKRVILLRSEPDKTVKIDKGPQWQQHVNAARAALNAALNQEPANG